MKWSRRYVCRQCGHKGRVSKAKRGPQILCPSCKKPTPARKIISNKNETITAPETFVVQLQGGTHLRMPAGRGPSSHYDRLLAVLDDCEVWEYEFDWDAEDRSPWLSGKKALASTSVIDGDPPQAKNTGED